MRLAWPTWGRGPSEQHVEFDGLVHEREGRSGSISASAYAASDSSSCGAPGIDRARTRKSLFGVADSAGEAGESGADLPRRAGVELVGHQPRMSYALKIASREATSGRTYAVDSS
jgi:hypothetical protein